jgi:hypothetical protein
MTSITRISIITAITASVVGMTLPPPAVADDSAVAEHDRFTTAQMVGLAPSLKSATQTLRGIVASVDESNDTVRIRQSQETTALKVQDGLLFNAVRYGDHVEVTVEDINGAKTIVGLMKE